MDETKSRVNTRFLYFLCIFMNGVPSVLIPVFPVYGLSLGATPLELGSMWGIMAIVYTISVLSLGGLWARLGRRVPIIFSSLLYCIVYLLYSLTTSTSQVLMLKFVEGFALSLFWPSIEALLGTSSGFGEETTSRFGLSFTIGAASGSFLSTFALAWGSFKSLFLVVSSLYLFSAVLNLYFLHGSTDSVGQDEEREQFGLSGDMFKGLKLVWASVAVSSASIAIIFSLFPAYADIQKIEVTIIGLSVFLISFGRAVAFLIFGRIKGENLVLVRVSAAFMAIGALPLALTKETVAVLSGSFAVGLGSGLLYSYCFHRLMTIDPRKNDIYAGVFEATVGVGFLTPILAGALAEGALNAPYLMVSAIAACLFAIASFMKQKTHT